MLKLGPAAIVHPASFPAPRCSALAVHPVSHAVTWPTVTLRGNSEKNGQYKK